MVFQGSLSGKFVKEGLSGSVCRGGFSGKSGFAIFESRVSNSIDPCSGRGRFRERREGWCVGGEEVL